MLAPRVSSRYVAVASQVICATLLVAPSLIAQNQSGASQQQISPIRLSRNCAATLHIIGTTPAGYIVLGTATKDGCIRVERWQLAHNKTVVRDGLSAEVADNHPAHLAPHAAVAKLEAGTPVEP